MARQTKEQLEWVLGEDTRLEAIEELRQIYMDRQNKPRTRLMALDKLIKLNAQNITLVSDAPQIDNNVTITIVDDTTKTN